MPDVDFDLDLPEDSFDTDEGHDWEAVTFHLTHEMRVILELALQKAKSQGDTSYPGLLLTRILADYLAGP